MNLNDSPPVLGRNNDIWQILTIFIIAPILNIHYSIYSSELIKEKLSETVLEYFQGLILIIKEF